MRDGANRTQNHEVMLLIKVVASIDEAGAIDENEVGLRISKHLRMTFAGLQHGVLIDLGALDTSYFLVCSHKYIHVFALKCRFYSGF